MTELPDDELGKLFRKSFEELDSTYDPDDWNKLRERLDAYDGKPLIPLWLKKWWVPGLLLYLVLTSFVTYYWTTKDNTVGQEKMILDNKLSDATKEMVSAGQQGADAEGKKPSDSESKLPNNSKNSDIKTLPRSKTKTGGVFLDSVRSNRKGSSGAFIANNDGTVSIEGMEERIKYPSDHIQKPVNRNNLPNDLVTKDVQTNSFKASTSADLDLKHETEPLERLFIPVDEIRKGTFLFGNDLELPEVAFVNEQTAIPFTKNTVQEAPKLALRFGFAPDMSSVEFMKGAKAGTSVSLLAEYAITPRLYLQAGAIRSVKKYVAESGYYQWPDNWSQWVMPDKIDGSCRIIEVPVNLRYDLRVNNQSRWFMTAGTSSFHMQNEKYTYNYEKHVPGIKWYKWEGKTGWYGFSHLNASVGFERKLSRRLSIQAEPYLTVPLKKVGFGKVNLFTTGAWVSIRYVPVLKK